MSSRPLPPISTRAVASELESIVGTTTTAHAYYDDDKSFVVAVAQANARPADELTTYSTVSLHGVENRLEDNDIRVELLMVATPDLALVPNVLASCAFNVMKEGWLAAPGVVFPHAIDAYYPASTTPHIMWSEPFGFHAASSAGVRTLAYEVHWLQAVPLTAREHDFLLQSGFDALSERLETANALHYDLNRESVC